MQECHWSYSFFCTFFYVSIVWPTILSPVAILSWFGTDVAITIAIVIIWKVLCDIEFQKHLVLAACLKHLNSLNNYHYSCTSAYDVIELDHYCHFFCTWPRDIVWPRPGISQGGVKHILTRIQIIRLKSG